MNRFAQIQKIGKRILTLGVFAIPFSFLWSGIAQPLKELLVRSVSDHQGNFIGLNNFVDFFLDTTLVDALLHSLLVSSVVMLLTVSTAFIVAFGLVRTHLFGKSILSILIQVPLFVPSIFPCLGLIYLFGGQGVLSPYLLSFELYGPIGVIMGGVTFTLPHAVLILATTLQGIDSRLYQAASCLGASSWQRFITITLANSRYGIISACFVVFTLTMTDFGIAKVLAGQYPMLATEIYKQVIGQHNFSMGSTISLLLIVPTCIAFFVDGWARKQQMRLANNNTLSEVVSTPNRDAMFTVIGWIPCIYLLVVIGVVVWGSFISYWPYDLSFTMSNYDFDGFGYGWEPYWNSLLLATMVAVIGVFITFYTSYLSLRVEVPSIYINILRLLALLPLSIPGTVLGLAYIFAFNRPGSFLGGFQGSFLILTFNTIIHLFSVSFLTFNSTIGRLDRNYERVGATLSVPQWLTFFRVIVPLSKYSLIDIFFYLFVNALTTVSAVVFLYGHDTSLASVVILNMDDSGNLAGASAMGTLLLITALSMKMLHMLSLHLSR